MPKFKPISKERHAGKSWRRPKDFAFTAREAVVPLVGAEFAKAAITMPIAFVEQAGRYVPVALMSPVAGRNLFVGPAGKWLGAYIPAALRSYPFRLAKVAGRDESVLCIDEDSGLLVDADATAESFFAADGKPSPATKAVLDFLMEVERSRVATDLAVAALADAGLIQLWPFQVNMDGKATPVTGLFRIDEAALNALSDEAFLKLRHCGALTLVYAQMLSTANLALLGQLGKLQGQAAQPASKALPETLDSIFGLVPDDTIQFR